ncbi:MAG: glycosyltransferase family 2 protein [Cyanobacteria bacterium SZAS LIN-2]|nr:glycosyltransferase family 2 protein [Cyanobacteria bacterium SZAS LIN-3]MBS1995826.1 glycosyltransferase family 2 protein [Cyanobacteria bacterium SZAS LIN-2]
MLLSIIIVSWNTKDLLDACLASVAVELEGTFGGLDKGQVFVVDNASADGSSQMVAQKYPWVNLIANADNRGFAAANNQAFALAAGDFVLMLNPDTEVKPGALKTLIDFFAEHEKAAVVAPQLLNSDGSIQRSCRQFPTFIGMLYELIGLSRMFPASSPRGIKFREYKMLDWNHDDERQVDQPEGACLMIKREILQKVGTLDEGFFMLFEEVDWCYRVKKAGWEIWFTPRAQVVHHYGQSIKQVKVAMILSSHRGLYRFWHKHYRGGRWWLDGVAYLGLMALAYVRIASYKLKALLAP